MASQTLDQVLASLNSVYDPQIQSVQQQQAALPGQYDAQAQGLKAQQDSAFGDIVNGARSRGLGFSGIPLADQAKYTATTYLPALANLKTSQNNQAASLTDAINKINETKFNTANNIYQYNTTLAEQQREFDLQQQAAARAAAQAAAANSFNPSLSAPSTPSSQAAATSQQDPNAKSLSGGKSLQDAYGAVQALLATRNPATITNTFKAIQQSANYGNTYDQQKILMINSLPQFQQYLHNSNNASF